jgi:hypothetical protein
MVMVMMVVMVMVIVTARMCYGGVTCVLILVFSALLAWNTGFSPPSLLPPHPIANPLVDCLLSSALVCCLLPAVCLPNEVRREWGEGEDG